MDYNAIPTPVKAMLWAMAMLIVAVALLIADKAGVGDAIARLFDDRCEIAQATSQPSSQTVNIVLPQQQSTQQTLTSYGDLTAIVSENQALANAAAAWRAAYVALALEAIASCNNNNQKIRVCAQPATRGAVTGQVYLP